MLKVTHYFAFCRHRDVAVSVWTVDVVVIDVRQIVVALNVEKKRTNTHNYVYSDVKQHICQFTVVTSICNVYCPRIAYINFAVNIKHSVLPKSYNMRTNAYIMDVPVNAHDLIVILMSSLAHCDVVIVWAPAACRHIVTYSRTYDC